MERARNFRNKIWIPKKPEKTKRLQKQRGILLTDDEFDFIG